MPTTTPVDVAHISQAISWQHQVSGGEPEVITLPGSGVLTAGAASIYRLANGSTLKGVAFLDDQGNPIEDSFDTHDSPQIVIEAEPGGSITLVHDDGGTTAANRLYVPGGANATLAGLTIQVFRQRADLGSGFVWRNKVNLRPIVASGVGYTPAAGADWANPDPTTVAAALDRLAAQVKALSLGVAVP